MTCSPFAQIQVLLVSPRCFVSILQLCSLLGQWQGEVNSRGQAPFSQNVQCTNASRLRSGDVGQSRQLALYRTLWHGKINSKDNVPGNFALQRVLTTSRSFPSSGSHLDSALHVASAKLDRGVARQHGACSADDVPSSPRIC